MIVVITISRFACVFRPAGSRSVKWDTCASPRHKQCTAAGKNVCNFIITFFHSRGRLEFLACSNALRHTWCTVVYLHDGKLLLGAGGTLSLCNSS